MRKQQFIQLLIFAMTYSVFLLLSWIVLRPAGQIAMIWPAGGLLISFFVTNPRSQWLKFLAIAYAATGVIEVGILDHSLLLSSIFFTLHALEASLGAIVIQKYCGGDRPFKTVQQLAIFVVGVVLGIPLFTSGIAAAAILQLTPTNSSFATTYYGWYSATGLGILFVAPCLILLKQQW